MNLLVRLSALSVLLGVLLAGPASAQDKGSITGRVTDKKSGHAIAFANVAVVGAQRGSLTDSEGQFNITGVPVGTWEVRVQFLGYRPEARPGVVVTAGKPTRVDFQLMDVVVREEKVVEVTAERRLVDVKQGSTVRSVNANTIRNMAVLTVGDVLQQQAGVTTEADQVHIRGGRGDEAVFLVNGVVNRDLVTGQSTAGKINARSVAEVNVATGAFDVKYGNAIAGVVDIKLKDGTDKFEGYLSSSTGSFGQRSWEAQVSGPDPVWTPMLKRLGVRVPGTVNSLLEISGDLAETRYRYLGKSPSLIQKTVYPEATYRLISSYEDSFFGHTFKYGDAFGPSADNRWGARYALAWKPGTRDKLTFGFQKRIAIDQGFTRTRIDVRGNQLDPSYPWSWNNRIQHASTYFDDNVQSSLGWRRTLGVTGYTELQMSRYFYAQRRDVMGKLWSEYVEPDDKSVYPPGDPRRDDYFVDSGDDNQWQDRRNTSYGIDWSLLQRVRRNEIEVGFNHQFQMAQYITIEDPWVASSDGLGNAHDQWRVHPWQGAMFLRDRLEYEGFAGNLGLRYDYWFPGREAERALADPTRENIPISVRDEFYASTSSFFGRRYKGHLSPRVMVSHPITENSKFYFNYGEFVQFPSYRWVYAKLNSISSENFPFQGNPSLNPQVSVNYEVAGETEFMKGVAGKVTLFQRDVYDYPNSVTITPQSGTITSGLRRYSIFVNGSFARSKGFEIELDKRRLKRWGSSITYSFVQTRGKESDPNENRQLAEIGSSGGGSLLERFVDWNRPHKLSASFDLRFDKDPPAAAKWLHDSSVRLYVNGQSGRAYTPRDSTNNFDLGAVNSKNGPIQLTTDLTLSRGFKLFGHKTELSVRGNNIFGAKLVYNIDPITGKGYKMGSGLFAPGYILRRYPIPVRRSEESDQAFAQRQAERENNVTKYIIGTLDDPSNYGAAAMWRAQIDVDF